MKKTLLLMATGMLVAAAWGCSDTDGRTLDGTDTQGDGTDADADGDSEAEEETPLCRDLRALFIQEVSIISFREFLIGNY